MDFKPVSREWVKNAAIIFLVILTVLTFFSNTIMNRTLPEIATAYASSGTITSKVRGSGKAVANGLHEVKMPQTREVRTVLVRAGQKVEVGDVLFVLGQGDSEELEKAQEALRELRINYQRSSLNMPTIDYTLLNRNVNLATQEVEKARLNFEEADKKYMDAIAQPLAKMANDRLTAAKIAYDAVNTKYNDNYATLEEPIQVYVDATNEYNARTDELGTAEANLAVLKASGTATPEEIAAAEQLVELCRAAQAAARDVADQAYSKLPEIDGVRYTSFEDFNAAYLPEVNKVTTELQEAQSELDALVDGEWMQREMTEEKLTSAETKYLEAQSQLDNAVNTNNKAVSTTYLELQEIAEQMEKQQEKIDKLAGDAGNEIVANVAGTVDSISVTAGDKVPADTVMCTVEVPDMGYTLSFSVTNDQAQRLRVGDTASISNFYWGNEVVATLSSIRNDPKNPQSNKLLTFELKGDVTSGAELTVSVGSKSANYDIVIPNSAIRTDTNGSFVYAVDAKNSPLGNRYLARRVKVEVIASDDEFSAVTGGLVNGDYVITTSSAPINNGDQVRMADSAT